LREGETREVHAIVDVAVVGAGAAGLYTALVAAESGARVRLISSSPLQQSASYRAQGGLAAALADDDSPALHLQDTLQAGRGAVRESNARIVCEEAPARVRELAERGVPFDAEPGGDLALGLEGGHSRRRVVHAGGSATGRQVADTLSRAVIAEDRITVHEQTSGLALWMEEGHCTGVVTEAGAMPAGATVLATGGAAALWKRTTNPAGAVGRGLPLARAAGAELADLELLQFHPTALVSEGELDGFLITEAVRGEGGLLLNDRRERFVDELAPRDEVTRAIHQEFGRSGEQYVLLDMRSVDPARFPNITQALAGVGLDPGRDLIPVAPAAHYMIGGIVVDGVGRSSVPHLFAVGECAATGVHGANRLASNSLSECFVFGRRAAEAAISAGPLPGPTGPPPGGIPPPAEGGARDALWTDGGIVRERAGLARLAAGDHPLARLIGRAALAREESRGCHLRSDFPDADPALEQRHLVFGPLEAEPRLERWE
jgi:L-aspartate oxidase